MNNNKYDDIILMAHHTSPTRPHMPIHDRAAQFAPFAALTGYDGMVEEAARLTDSETELGEYDIERIDTRLRILKEHERSRPYVEVIHFVPDKHKAGGKYITSRAKLCRVDDIEKQIQLEDGKKIEFKHISTISSLLFSDE